MKFAPRTRRRSEASVEGFLDHAGKLAGEASRHGNWTSDAGRSGSITCGVLSPGSHTTSFTLRRTAQTCW